MWSSHLSFTIAAVLLTGCGGSSTAQRPPAPAPTATPDADVGRAQAERDAALRRQGSQGAPSPSAQVSEPPSEGTPKR